MELPKIGMYCVIIVELMKTVEFTNKLSLKFPCVVFQIEDELLHNIPRYLKIVFKFCEWKGFVEIYESGRIST